MVERRLMAVALLYAGCALFGMLLGIPVFFVRRACETEVAR